MQLGCHSSHIRRLQSPWSPPALMHGSWASRLPWPPVPLLRRHFNFLPTQVLSPLGLDCVWLCSAGPSLPF